MSGSRITTDNNQMTLHALIHRVLAEGGPITTSKRRLVAKSHREALFDALGRVCGSCRSTARLTFDHIIPWSHGGRRSAQISVSSVGVATASVGTEQPRHSFALPVGPIKAQGSICYNHIPAIPPVPRWSSL